MKLEGKIAVITGGSKGIGAAIAKKLAACGAIVIVNYVNSKEDADLVVNTITAGGGNAIAIRADVAKAGDVKDLF